MPIIWYAFFIGYTGSGFSLPRTSFIWYPIFIGYQQLVSDQSPIKIEHVWNLHYKIRQSVVTLQPTLAHSNWSYILCSYYNHDRKWIIAFNGIIRSGWACIHKLCLFDLFNGIVKNHSTVFFQFVCGAKIEGEQTTSIFCLLQGGEICLLPEHARKLDCWQVDAAACFLGSQTLNSTEHSVACGLRLVLSTTQTWKGWSRTLERHNEHICVTSSELHVAVLNLNKSSQF